MAEMANVAVLQVGGTYYSAQGEIHINNKDSGLDILRLGVSLGAIHDSAERYPSPNCHPGTRKAVQQIILNWIESSPTLFLWLYGPAGAGKTAILQAIAELLCSPSGSGQNLGGSFFFSRGKKGRDQGHFLFSTIAYQLALNVPGLRQHVNRIMELNPSLHTKSMVVQINDLIVKAFKDLSPIPQHSYLIIIDGLDECHDKATQQFILLLLREMITVHKLPLRFLIGSRPETHIRASFDQESLHTMTHRVVLDELFDPGRDIRVFLQDGFAKICSENFIPSNVEQPWPSEGIIDLLVKRSSGQFIYPTTVLKFVGADFCSPTKQLELVLKPDPMAFSDLDQLYTQILSVYPSEANIVQVLGFIIAFDEKNLPEVIEDILEMDEGGLKLVLRGLSSLMKDEKDENGERLNKGVVSYAIPNFAHASFSDYLFDASRSGSFHVNRQEYIDQVTMRSFKFIMKLIRSQRMSSITRVPHTTTWVYFTSCLPDRFSRSSKVVKEAIMKDINDLVEEYLRISNDGAVGAPFSEMRRLLDILQACLDNFEMPSFLFYAAQSDPDALDSRIKAKLKILLEGYRKMFDQSFSKSKPGHGVVVQKRFPTPPCFSNMSTRAIYRGPKRKLVLAFDVGTTYSGISYSVLDPGQVPEIKGVTRFPALEHISGASKIPTVIYYDLNGKVRAVGAEAMKEGVCEDAEVKNWVKAEWFKLHLRSKIGAGRSVGSGLPPLPLNKTIEEVFADFLRYLLECASSYIQDTHANGPDLWNSVKSHIDFVLSHPNGWEGTQQSEMRRAAVLAGLVPDNASGQSRLSFVTEGEASLHFSVQNGLPAGVMKNGDGVVIVDAGGGTVDISSYSRNQKESFEEIAAPQCHFHGSVFVTFHARRFLKSYLSDSPFLDDLDHIVRCFDKTTKHRFRNAEEPEYVKFGSTRDNDESHNIRFGQLKLTGSNVAQFFQPSIDCIVKAVLEQKNSAHKTISHVVLVGGFAASDWLFSKVNELLTPLGLNIVRPENHVNKAVSDGAISFYLDHFVRTRVSKITYGSFRDILYDPSDPDHQSRSHNVFTGACGTDRIGDNFRIILPNSTRVLETKEFRKSYSRKTVSSNFRAFKFSLWCYRGNVVTPKWKDVDTNNYTKLCTIEADLSRAPIVTLPKATGEGSFYIVDYDIILFFGMTELQAQLAWKENGKEKRSAATIVYDPQADNVP